MNPKAAAASGQILKRRASQQSGDPMEAATALALQKGKAPAPESLPAEKAPGNDLGNAFHGVKPAQMPALEVLVQKWRGALRAVADMPALLKARAGLAGERALIEEHSCVTCAQRVERLAHAYAQAPNAENLEALRHARTLEMSDHVLVQQYAEQRRAGILASISPAFLPILKKAAELCQKDAEVHWAHDSEHYRAAGVEPVQSDLVRGLASLAKQIKGQSEVKKPFSDFPEIVEKLLLLE